MNTYSSDKTTLLLLSLLKAHHIRNVIASPGTTNMALVGSMQSDSFFIMYSAPDERSAAYMACGLASESGEPVIITCTEATASRNYYPALTEAYYRKLPILVITGYHGESKIGHLISQAIDRSIFAKDILKLSVSLTRSNNAEDEWSNIININKAILELDHHGKGPVHINLLTSHSSSFNQKSLPVVRKISRYSYCQDFPDIPKGRIAIFIGSHESYNTNEVLEIENFCVLYDAVVFCDNTSGYNGKYRVNFSLVAGQQNYKSELLNLDLLIHLGEVSGATYLTSGLKPKQVWRIGEDGEIRDIFKKLTCVFETKEETFFAHYTKRETQRDGSDYYELCLKEYNDVYARIPDLPFSNIWMAKEMRGRLPINCVIHFSIFNSLRSWNFFNLHSSIISTCNVGGFGIDGSISTVLGAALSNPDKIHFLIIGDLAFFYDLNSMGNRHFQNNIRILLVNNGCGVEFKKKDHPASKLGNDADLFISAGGHYGNKSDVLVKHYSEDLGFKYLAARNKMEFLENINIFLEEKQTDKPIIFETFPDADDEVLAANMMRNLVSEPISAIKDNLKTVLKKIVK